MSEERNPLLDDYALYFEKCLKIRDKSSRIVPFIPNAGQKKLLKIVEDWKRQYPDEESRSTLYIVILKARQIGFSTCSSGIFFHDLHFSSNMVSMIVSFDDDSANTIADMSDRFYQYLPQFLKPQTRPSRAKGILFENPKFDPSKPVSNANKPGLQNKYLIETARNMNAGSSYTINRLHVSEIGKWTNPAQTMTSLLQSIPDKGAIVILESTAQGMNYFADLFEKSIKGENRFVPLFMPWHEHPDYRSSYRGFTLTPEEEELKKTYGLDDDQLQWRRDTISDKLNGDARLFCQEYPINWRQAFLVTGTGVFDNEIVIRRMENLKAYYKENPPFVGSLFFDIDDNADRIKLSSVRVVADRHGWLTVYEPPQDGHSYCIGGDIAEGGLDWSTMVVFDASIGKQVATWRAHTDTDLYAKQAVALAKYYTPDLATDCLISIESNFDKHPIKWITHQGWRNQYRRETVDAISNKIEQRYGFVTSKNTRPIIIGELVQLVRESVELINCPLLLEECLYFVRDEQGRPAAQEGSNRHDDLVMAAAIGYYCMSQQTGKIRRREPERTFIQKHKYNLLNKKKERRIM